MRGKGAKPVVLRSGKCWKRVFYFSWGAALVNMGRGKGKMNIPTVIDRRVYLLYIYIHIHTHTYMYSGVHSKASKFKRTDVGQKSGTTLQLLLEHGEIASQGDEAVCIRAYIEFSAGQRLRGKKKKKESFWKMSLSSRNEKTKQTRSNHQIQIREMLLLLVSQTGAKCHVALWRIWRRRAMLSLY